MSSRDDERDDVPDLTPEDEAAVAALLASLPATPMPPEVLARIEAALAAEPALAATAAVTTLAEARERRRPSRGPLVFRIAASLVAVVGLTALGIAFVNGGGSTSGGSSGSTADMAEGGTSSAAAASAPSAPPAGGTLVTKSGKTYTAADLAAQAAALLSAAGPVPAAGSGSAAASSAAPSPSGKSLTPQSDTAYLRAMALAGNREGLAACVKELTDGDGRTPLAVDTGRWDNQAALVIVLPADAASGQRQVFVVKPTCGTTDDSSDILQVAFLDQ